MNFYGSSWNIFFATFVQIRLQKVVGEVQKGYYFFYLQWFQPLPKWVDIFLKLLLVQVSKVPLWETFDKPTKFVLTSFEDSTTLIFFWGRIWQFLGGTNNNNAYLAILCLFTFLHDDDDIHPFRLFWARIANWTLCIIYIA